MGKLITLVGVLLFTATFSIFGWVTTTERGTTNQVMIDSLQTVNLNLSNQLKHDNDSVVGICPRCGWEIKSTYYYFKDVR
jgi:hypothetical protein